MAQAEDRHIYTVSQLTQDIKNILENTFIELWVEGEVSGLNKHFASGTIFFSLKDETSLIKCVIFNTMASSLKFDLKDGMKIICFGRVGVYEKDGRYQLYVRRVEPKGLGALQLALEQLKEKLQKEGLFAEEHKKPIPYLPSRIGLVTSLSGAAINDIFKVLDERYKDVHIIVNPVRVQGDGAKEEIAAAIKDFNDFNLQVIKNERIEVMIVGRGGGSVEDLWAFNEEIVARAIYASTIPVISAVGHERDWSIADLVADLRAPTPSAAAEQVIPRKEDLRRRLNEYCQGLELSFKNKVYFLFQELEDFEKRLQINLTHLARLNKERLAAAVKKLSLLNPQAALIQHREKIKQYNFRIGLAVTNRFKFKEAGLQKASSRLNSLSPLNILSRGYSIVFKFPQGEIIKDIRELKIQDQLKLRLHRGEIRARVEEVLNG